PGSMTQACRRDLLSISGPTAACSILLWSRGPVAGRRYWTGGTLAAGASGSAGLHGGRGGGPGGRPPLGRAVVLASRSDPPLRHRQRTPHPALSPCSRPS